MPGTKYFCLVAHSVAILSQDLAAPQFRRHGVSVILFCFLWALSAATAPLSARPQMPHCRSDTGRWNHEMRSWERGYRSQPPEFCPFAPPPPPPPIVGDDYDAVVLRPKPSRLLFKEVIAAPHRFVFDEDEVTDIVGEQELEFLYEESFADFDRAHADSNADADCVPVFFPVGQVPVHLTVPLQHYITRLVADSLARGVVPVYPVAESGIFKANEQLGVETDASDAEPGVFKADEEENRIVQTAHTSCNTEANILQVGLEVDAVSGVGIDALDAEPGVFKADALCVGVQVGIEIDASVAVPGVVKADVHYGDEVVAIGVGAAAGVSGLVPKCISCNTEGNILHVGDASGAVPGVFKADGYLSENVSGLEPKCISCNTEGNIVHVGEEVDAVGDGINAVGVGIADAVVHIGVENDAYVLGARDVGVENDACDVAVSVGEDAAGVEEVSCRSGGSADRSNFELIHLHEFDDLIALDETSYLKLLCLQFLLPCQPDKWVVSCLSHIVVFFEQRCAKYAFAVQGLVQEQLAEQIALLVDSVKKLVWSKILLFLESNWASFLSICEDRPDKAWRRALIGVSLGIDKFVKLPSGKILFPFKYESLKSHVENILGTFCIGLKATFSDEEFSTFFGNPNVHSVSELVYSNQVRLKRYSFLPRALSQNVGKGRHASG